MVPVAVARNQFGRSRLTSSYALVALDALTSAREMTSGLERAEAPPPPDDAQAAAKTARDRRAMAARDGKLFSSSGVGNATSERAATIMCQRTRRNDSYCRGYHPTLAWAPLALGYGRTVAAFGSERELEVVRRSRWNLVPMKRAAICLSLVAVPLFVSG